MKHYNRTDRERFTHIFIVSFLLFCLVEGIVVVAIGSWVVHTQVTSCNFVSVYSSESYVTIAAGIGIILVAIAGLVLTKYNKIFAVTKLLLFCSLIVVVLQVTVMGLVSLHRKQIFNLSIYNSLTSRMFSYYDDGSSKACWDSIHVDFQCCGLWAATDWYNTSYVLHNQNDTDFFDPPDLGGSTNFSKSSLPKLVAGGSIPMSCSCNPNNRELAEANNCNPIPERGDYDNTTLQVFVHSDPCYLQFEDVILKQLTSMHLSAPIISCVQVVHLIVTAFIVLKLNNPLVVEAQYEASSDNL